MNSKKRGGGLGNGRFLRKKEKEVPRVKLRKREKVRKFGWFALLS